MCLLITKHTLFGIAYVFCFVCRFLIQVGFPSVLGGCIALMFIWFFPTINVGLRFALSIALSVLSGILYTTFVYPILNRFFDAFELLLFGRAIFLHRPIQLVFCNYHSTIKLFVLHYCSMITILPAVMNVSPPRHNKLLLPCSLTTFIFLSDFSFSIKK